MSKFCVKLVNLVNNLIVFLITLTFKIGIMKFSKQALIKLKNKNRKLKPNKYRKLKREAIRGKVKGTSERPRLSIYRSNENIYVQIIDDTISKTLVSCSTLDRSVKIDLESKRTCEASKIIGEKLAELSLKQNITKVVFDKGPYLYHGRIKALADGARSGGLQF
jgi:large subunit ribosomal protein L18